MRPRPLSVLVTALGLLALGPLVLGLDWRGHEIRAGVWRDGVGLWRWGLLYALLAVSGALAARRVPSFGTRVAALAPLLCWVGWMLRHSALGPLAWVTYAVPAILAWLGGSVLGGVASTRVGTPRERPGA